MAPVLPILIPETILTLFAAVKRIIYGTSMLHFFRSIRRSFFQPGKVKTYLAYANGEIVLIMIGIFLVLQLKNWNEDRKIERRRRSFWLRSMKNFSIIRKNG